MPVKKPVELVALQSGPHPLELVALALQPVQIAAVAAIRYKAVISRAPNDVRREVGPLLEDLHGSHHGIVARAPTKAAKTAAPIAASRNSC